MINFLIYSFLFFLPFGQILRLEIIKSVFVNPTDIIALIIFIFYTIKQFQKPTVLRLKLIIPVFIFIIICFLSLILNFYSLTLIQLFVSSLYIFRLIFYFSLYFVIAEKTQTNKKRIIFFTQLSGIFFCFLGFIQFFLYPSLSNLSYLGWDNHWYRLFSTFFDPNFAGIFLCLILNLLVQFPILKKNKYWKILNLFLVLFLIIGIILTFSRSTIIAFIAGFIIFFFKKRSEFWLKIISIVVFIFGILIVLLNYNATEGTKLFRINSSIQRITSASNAIQIFQKNPIFGVGFDAYRYAQFRYKLTGSYNWEEGHSNSGTDNSFLFVLATTGVFGFFSFGYLLFKIFKQYDATENTMYVLRITSFGIVCFGSLFINALFYPSILSVLFIILGLTEENKQA